MIVVGVDGGVQEGAWAAFRHPIPHGARMADHLIASGEWRGKGSMETGACSAAIEEAHRAAMLVAAARQPGEDVRVLAEDVHVPRHQAKDGRKVEGAKGAIGPARTSGVFLFLASPATNHGFAQPSSWRAYYGFRQRPTASAKADALAYVQALGLGSLSSHRAEAMCMAMIEPTWAAGPKARRAACERQAARK